MAINSILPYRYKVNGLIDTAQTVMRNLELIGNSCATWITYDIMDGKWAVVINRAGDPVHAFNDDNIIGSVNMSSTGLTDLYNSVEVKFPHRDLRDQMDWVKIEIPSEDRLPNEPDNCLTIDLPVINEPIQAQIVGLIELKQSRLDKIIQFQTDYSMINLAAGDIITVTNSVYNWTNKEFRIIRMEETDANGTIVIDITALEYSDSVYDLSDLYRYERTNSDGIITQGQIGEPSQPVVTKYEQDANPRIEIASDVPDGLDPLNPTGIVEGMEFWISSDGSNYTLLNTLKPSGTNVFDPGETVTLTYNNAQPGNVYVKTRCVNSTTVSPYSDPSGIQYAPVQTTDNIDQNTTLSDNSGPILTALALSTLLNKLSQMFGAGDGGLTLGQALSKNGGLDLTVIDTIDYGISATQTKLNAMCSGYTTQDGYDIMTVLSNLIEIPFTLSTSHKLTEFTVTTPICNFDYEFMDRTGTVRTMSSFVAQPSMGISIINTGTNVSYGDATIDWQTNNVKFTVENIPAGSYQLQAYILPTYDLDMYWPRTNVTPSNKIFFTNFTVTGSSGLKLSIVTTS